MPPPRAPRPPRVELAFAAREAAFRFFAAPTTGGFVFGVVDAAGGDVRLTVFVKEGGVRAGVGDPSRIPDHVLGRTFPPGVLVREIERRGRGLVRPYRADAVAGILRAPREGRAAAALGFPSGNGAVRIPLAALRGSFLADPGDARRWRRVRIRELLGMPATLGVRVEAGRFCFVRPLDGRTMVVLPEGEFLAIVDRILEALGFGACARDGE